MHTCIFYCLKTKANVTWPNCCSDPFSYKMELALGTAYTIHDLNQSSD